MLPQVSQPYREPHRQVLLARQYITIRLLPQEVHVVGLQQEQ